MIVKPKIRGEIVIKKLSKFGNSTALIIDKPILRLLNMEKKLRLIARLDRGRLALVCWAGSVRVRVISYRRDHAYSFV